MEIWRCGGLSDSGGAVHGQVIEEQSTDESQRSLR